MKNILVTGANGFIAKNLISHLQQSNQYKIFTFSSNCDLSKLKKLVESIDVVVHLAASNRPKNVSEFSRNNINLTDSICNFIKGSGKIIPVLFASSIQAELTNPYGLSKKISENILEKFSNDHKNPVCIFRLQGVFGKWCKPNYNSVVATFCNNIIRGIEIDIHDPNRHIDLLYIDDVVNEFIQVLNSTWTGVSRRAVSPVYRISIAELSQIIHDFHVDRGSGKINRVGSGLLRALYSTYLSFLTPDQFSLKIPQSIDQRGAFVEILKTQDSGQFSFFTAFPGITRGEHYHHSKSEKFLVVHGQALFRFRNISTDENYEVLASSNDPMIVDSIPGWSHSITNIGISNLIVVVWANEIFNKDYPDTFQSKV